MNVHIAPIGTLSDEHIRRAIRYYPVDKLYLIPTKESKDKAEQLKGDLENTFPDIEIKIKKLEESGKERYIDPFNHHDIINAITQIAKAEKGNRLFINITGGTNLMAGGATAAAYIASSITSTKAYYVKKPQENESLEELIVELPILKIYEYNIEKIKILKLILNKGGRINKAKEIADKLTTTPQTISSHLKKLEKDGLVKVTVNENNRRQKQYIITDKGRIMATLLEV